MSSEQQIQELEQEIDNKIKQMNKFRQQMKARRIKEDIEEENPFKIPNTEFIDRKIQAIRKQQDLGAQAGIVSQERINQILKKVDKSLGMNEKKATTL